MTDLVAVYGQAVAGFGGLVGAIGADQWGSSTPNTEWDVRALVSHVLVENLWVPPLLDGMTIAEVGDRLDGDQLGDDPGAAWAAATQAAVAAVGKEGVLDETVHLSFGDFPGSGYVSQLVCDHLIHAWDLARAIGANEQMDGELVEFVTAFLTPQAEDWRAGGAFGPKVDLPAGADAQSQLLALTGRRP